MSGGIRAVYSVAPNFPATDQHPSAVRYHVGAYWVDAIDGQPTAEEVDAFLHPEAPPSDAGGLAEAAMTIDFSNSETAVIEQGILLQGLLALAQSKGW